MSISSIQRRRLFEEVTRVFYASGEKPRVTDILTEVSRYFAKYPPGIPLRTLQGFAADGTRSDVNQLNAAFFGVQHNLSVAYESALEQVSQIMMLTSVLQSNLERLRTKRNRLTSTIDDYLFTLFNSDGYFASVSDGFDDLNLTDLSLTSAVVDTSIGQLVLPTSSDLTTTIPINRISLNPNVRVMIDGKSKGISFKTLSPFANAIDGLSNTIWAIEVEAKTPAEVIVGVSIPIGSVGQPELVSRIEIDPWGIEPVQMMVRTQDNLSSSTRSGPLGGTGNDEMMSLSDVRISLPPDVPASVYTQIGFLGMDFDSRIVTSPNKVTFTGDASGVTSINLFLRKKTPDYTVKTSSGSTLYRYIFGAKDIVITNHVYDREAVFVSNPLTLSPDIQDEHVIDAVNLVATALSPTNTSIKYWVAADVDTPQPEIGDFEWKRIVPLEKTEVVRDSAVRFDGALSNLRDIRVIPRSGDLQLIPTKTTGPQVDLNPTPYIVQGTDIWRIASFEDDMIPSTAKLEEGINTARVLHVAASNLKENTIDFWTKYLDGTLTATELYTPIDKGLGFFDGGVIGEDNRYVYVETFLETDAASELLLRKLSKIDTNSRNWDVKAYLNGREVGLLPLDIDTLTIPWKFTEGLNQVILLITIPYADDDAPRVYDGKITLMEDSDLFDFGTVKLATWDYVDFFHIQYNEVDSPFTFTIREAGLNKKEIISRRKPTDNFRFKYSKSTNNGPTAIRLRVDLTRTADDPHVTPSVNQYRIRFLYA